ncbi:MAG: head-tail connector protein, partial [Alphaproteobacteria bacterium]
MQPSKQAKPREGLFFCPYFSDMMTVEITGTPTLDSVITVADLKSHLRVDHSDEDTLIEAYRDAAIKWIEDYCNTRLGDVTAVGYLDYFKPSRFPIGP